jgi:hypothetical protein
MVAMIKSANDRSHESKEPRAAEMMRIPVRVRPAGTNEWRYACRICMSDRALAADEFLALPTDRDVIVAHIEREHRSTLRHRMDAQR